MWSGLEHLLSGVRTGAKCFQGYFQGVFEAFHLASVRMLSLLQLIVRQSFGQLLVWPTGYMTCPLQLGQHQDSVPAGQACLCKDLSVWNLVLPLAVDKIPKATVWKWFSFFAQCWYTVHVSHAMSSTGSIVALYIFSFVCRLIPLAFQTLACSLLKVSLPFTILVTKVFHFIHSSLQYFGKVTSGCRHHLGHNISEEYFGS